MTLGFLSGSKNFCKLLWVSCEVFVLHGYDWIHWVAKSCTTTAYRWLFRDSQLSLRTLWSAVIKSPKLSARGTASPLRLLHGALVILVRLQISQFRSLGKWVWTLCLPKSSRLMSIGSKEASWEELAWESPRTGTSSPTKISLNSCCHSGIFSQRVAPVSHQHRKLTQALESYHLSDRSSLSRVSLSLDVAVVGEEDVEQGLSCLEGVIDVEEGKLEGELVDKPGTTIGTEFSVSHCLRIPFLMRCGFWPLIHS